MDAVEAKSTFSQQYGWSMVNQKCNNYFDVLAIAWKIHGTSLNEESLSTLLTEVEEIKNSRPLTTDLLSDVNSMIPFSPINLLTLRSRAVVPLPGFFTASDI